MAVRARLLDLSAGGRGEPRGEERTAADKKRRGANASALTGDNFPIKQPPFERDPMANTTSAKKRARRDARKVRVNGARRARVRTFVKKVEAAIAAGDREAAGEALRKAQPELMRGVTRGVVKKNMAARKISRLSRRIKAL